MFLKKKNPIEFKRWHAIVLGIMVVVAIFLYVVSLFSSSETRVIIGGKELSVLVADNPAKQVQGLSDRASVAPYDGMLFIFPDRNYRAFVMRRMHFALDIIWIDRETVVDISPELPPEDGISEERLTRYGPKMPVDKVLEVPAGFVQRNGIKVGDSVRILR
jgi:uncharacterized membrane protein (UPF0127 family)